MKIDDGDIWHALKKKYSAPAFALFSEIANGTGMRRRRYADALAMSLYPSRGLDLYGFEIKVSRSDWLRELKNPAKADEIGKYCTFWYVVTPPDIVKKEELPATWGLLILKKNGLHQEVQPTKMKPKRLDPVFVASILRRAHEMATAKESTDDYDRGYRAGVEKKVEVGAIKVSHEVKELRRLAVNVKEFEEASGLSLKAWWGGRELGQAVQLIERYGADGLAQDYSRLIEKTEGNLQGMKKLVEMLRAVEAKKAKKAKSKVKSGA